jgi:hypothetical protein
MYGKTAPSQQCFFPHPHSFLAHDSARKAKGPLAKLSGLSDFAGFCGRVNSHSKVEREEGQGMKARIARLDHIVLAFDEIVELAQLPESKRRILFII